MVEWIEKQPEFNVYVVDHYKAMEAYLMSAGHHPDLSQSEESVRYEEAIYEEMYDFQQRYRLILVAFDILEA
jgi:hypothetical protein